MKIKHLFSVLGLGLFAMAVASAGVLGQAKKAEPAKATEGDWMFRVQFDSNDAGKWTGTDAISNVRFHYWGDGGVDATVNLGPCAMARSGVTVYGTNIVLGATQTVNGGQFIFDQAGKGAYNQYSLNLSNCTFSAEDTSNRIREWYYLPDPWEEEGGVYKFKTFYHGSTDAPVVKMTDMANLAFTPNPSLNRWEAKNWEFVENEKTLSQRFLTFDLGAVDYSVSMLTAETKEEFGSDGADYSACWYRLPAYGTHDFFLEATSSGDGQMVIKKHTSTDTVNIYYVLENNTPTNDYIYTWGGSEQFGSWPGTKVTEVDGVQEVTNNGVFHFQGSETPKLIYKIPVKIGYPVGDSQFKFNNNGTMETDARPINNCNAYWWSGDPNSLAGSAIKFLVETETIRNSVADTSVCNISKEQATSIVYSYMSLGKYMQQTYIDCTTVLTHKRDGSAGDELVSYRLVIEQLAKIAELESELGIGSRYYLFGNETVNSRTTIVIVSVIALVSFSSLSLLVVLKKRKQN